MWLTTGALLLLTGFASFNLNYKISKTTFVKKNDACLPVKRKHLQHVLETRTVKIKCELKYNELQRVGHVSRQVHYNGES
jgi:hypothetical protein